VGCEGSIGATRCAGAGVGGAGDGGDGNGGAGGCMGAGGSGMGAGSEGCAGVACIDGSGARGPALLPPSNTIVTGDGGGSCSGVWSRGIAISSSANATRWAMRERAAPYLRRLSDRLGTLANAASRPIPPTSAAVTAAGTSLIRRTASPGPCRNITARGACPHPRPFGHGAHKHAANTKEHHAPPPPGCRT
jgi:hypothetical protein